MSQFAKVHIFSHIYAIGQSTHGCYSYKLLANYCAESGFLSPTMQYLFLNKHDVLWSPEK